MAWTSPGTVVVGQLLTASLWNIQVRDNMLVQAACARVFHNAAQSIAHNTVTVLAFNSERYDTDTIHDTVTNNSRLTCKTAGKYTITGNAEWAGNASGFRELAILLNGTTIIGTNDLSVGGVAGTLSHCVSTEYALAINDFVELRAYQNSGAALNVSSSGNYSPEFSMHGMAG